MTDKTYKVYLTPLIDENTYGEEIEITDFVTTANLSSIKKNTDSDDYTIGRYLLGAVELTCINYNGQFNENDPRSFFSVKRDLAKIRVVYFDSLTVSSGSFRGIINDEGTKSDAEREVIEIRVLALDSILRKVQIQPGLILTGDLFSTAIKKILNVPGITAILNFDQNEINLDLDLEIDVGGFFNSLPSWEGIKQILIASNSVIYVDDETVKVKTRQDDTGLVSYFYGSNDILDRENIIKISDYNNGAHRIFNSIMINDTVSNDDISINWFGLKQNNFTLEFITDVEKELSISTNLVKQFRYPRIEFKLTCTTEKANSIDFFDTIGVDYSIRSRPYRETNPPQWDTALYDTTKDVYPIDFGGVTIDGRLAFQIIERTENPSLFQTTLKLRGRGKTFDDGLLIFWAAVWGLSRYDISTW